MSSVSSTHTGLSCFQSNTITQNNHNQFTLPSAFTSASTGFSSPPAFLASSSALLASFTASFTFFSSSSDFCVSSASFASSPSCAPPHVSSYRLPDVSVLLPCVLLHLPSLTAPSWTTRYACYVESFHFSIR